MVGVCETLVTLHNFFCCSTCNEVILKEHLFVFGPFSMLPSHYGVP